MEGWRELFARLAAGRREALGELYDLSWALANPPSEGARGSTEN